MHGDDRVVGGVGFIETVIGEEFDHVEYVFGGFLRDAVDRTALHKDGAMFVQVFGFLFGHGAAHQVSFAQFVVEELAGNLHDLLLIYDDAVGFAEDGLEARMQIFDLFIAVHAVAVLFNKLHRAGPGKAIWRR